MNSPAPGTSGQGIGSSFNACLPCRRIKMKCPLSHNATKCDRCVRKSLVCEFQQHRRGRKLGTRLNLFSTNKGCHPADVESVTEAHAEGIMPASFAQEHTRQASAERPRYEPDEPEPEPEPARRGFWSDTDGFQPFSLLNRQAARGSFSLQNILSTNLVSTANTTSLPTAREDDPISKGLLNHAIATSLYQGYEIDSRVRSIQC